MTQALSRRSMLHGSAAFAMTSLLTCGYGTVAVSEDRAARRTNLTLRVQEVNGRPTYNGHSPGPTIVADPGDTIDVYLINDLPALHDDCADNHNSFHGLNTTNLHTHGLHVSPTTDSSGRFDADNVFISVVPKNQVVPCVGVGAEG
ncbi:MAG: multicopper oxidase domain-containing protein, partial [Boseongicola sp.]|nr:multicopper oxidase domain-containing protein [Boseongicola sp.]